MCQNVARMHCWLWLEVQCWLAVFCWWRPICFRASLFPVIGHGNETVSPHCERIDLCVSSSRSLSRSISLSLSLSFLFFLLFLSITLSIFLNFYPFTDFCMTFLALSAISSHNYQIFPAWPLNDRFVIVSDFQYPCLLCLLFSSFFLALFGCP